MKKVTFILAAVVMLVSTNMQAQQSCGDTYNLFKGDVQTKRYDEAYTKLVNLMDKCPSLSVNVYKYGDRIAEYRYKTETDKNAAFAFVKKVYEQRLKYFPKNDPAKVHGDYANFLTENKLGSDDEIFAILQKAYSIDPMRMGLRNIYKYFQEVVDRNKDSNPQKVFDTYDDVVESVQKKLDDYSKKLAALNAKVDNGETLGKRDKSRLNAYTINSKILGQIEGSLDAIIVKISTCDNLIPLYTRDFDANKTNAKWLERAVSRMYSKKCTDAPLYEKLVESWVAAAPSPKNTVYYAGILYQKGNESEAMEYYKKAVDQETDPYEKANSLYKIAQLFAQKGQKSTARSYAYKALKYKPNMGKAYLLIASLYASSVNECGTNEFEKRLVYTAALDKVRKAVRVDPSIASKASAYIRNYLSNEPSKKLIFTASVKPGSPYKIKCWINETVKIPQK